MVDTVPRAADVDESAVQRFAHDVQEFAQGIGVEALLSPWRNGFGLKGVELTDLNTYPTGRGNGTKVMNFITNVSDNERIPVVLSPGSSRNERFYRRFGFSMHGDNRMVRFPA
jgi:hypothetical protein